MTEPEPVLRRQSGCMGHKCIYIFAGAICLNLACSREPQSAQRAKSVVEAQISSAPAYSAASIVPTGATQPAPLAPGRVASIYGRNLGPAQPCHGSPEPSRREKPNPLRPNQTLIETQIFPGSLCATEVYVGAAAAGLLYVSAGQINFKVPQTTQTHGDTRIRVVHKGQAGPSVSISLTADSPASSAEQIAATMWLSLRSVQWQRQYQPATGHCAAVRAHQALRGGLYGHAYYCAQTKEDVIAESFYYPVDHNAPRLLMLRADIRPVNAYPELSAEIEQHLIRRLEKAYGAGAAPDHVFEIGAARPCPGLSWTTGDLTIFLHRNPNHVEPGGVRRGVLLIALRNELLEQRRTLQNLSDPLRSFPTLSQHSMMQELEKQLPGAYFSADGKPPHSEADRVTAEQRVRTSLLRLLRQSAGDPEQRAASLVAADDLARRLGSLLVVRSVNNGSEILDVAQVAGKVRNQLAAHGVRFGEIGHYSVRVRPSPVLPVNADLG